MPTIIGLVPGQVCLTRSMLHVGNDADGVSTLQYSSINNHWSHVGQALRIMYEPPDSRLLCVCFFEGWRPL